MMRYALLATFLLWSTMAWTEPEMEYCEQPHDSPDVMTQAKAAICGNYLQGMVFMDITHGREGAERLLGCVPLEATSPNQLRLVWIGYVREHPENRHLGVSGLAARAFREAWPCKQ